MNLRPNPARLYGRSGAEAPCLLKLSLGPPLTVFLPVNAPTTPLHGGYRSPPQAPEGADLADALPFGSWRAPHFTQHRPTYHGYLHVTAQGDGPDWLTPQAALTAWKQGGVLLDTPTQIILHALAKAPLHTEAPALAKDLAEALYQANRRLPPEDGPLAQLPHAVRPGIYMLPLRSLTLPPATHTNCVIVGDQNLFVIDPATPWDDDRRRLDALLDEMLAGGGHITAILLTHHHGDHIAGAAHVASRYGCPIWCHPVTAALIPPELGALGRLSDGDVLPAEGSSPWALRCLFTPGHAPGHLCFEETHTRTLIAGDMVAGWGSIVITPPEGEMNLYLHHLGRLAALAPAAVIPAHGPAMADGAGVFEAFAAHRLQREQSIVDALSPSPLSPEALTQAVYPDVPPAIRPLAQGSLLAHLLKLEADGRVQVSLDGSLRLVRSAPPS